MEFIKYLQQLELGKRLAIFWDEVTYHNSQEFRAYLMTINQEKPE
jgi:putative transposase